MRFFICTAMIVLCCVAILTNSLVKASSLSSSLLETVWSIDGVVSDYPSYRDPTLIASNVGIVVVDDEEATITAIVGVNGTVLWSMPRAPCCGPNVTNKTAEDRYFLNEMHFLGNPESQAQELLLVHYLPPFIVENNPFRIVKLPNICRIFNISTGDVINEFEIPFGFEWDHDDEHYVILGQPEGYSSPWEVNFTRISPLNGSIDLLWSRKLPSENKLGSFAVEGTNKILLGEDVVVVSVTSSRVTNSSHQFALSLDKQEGEIVCVAPLPTSHSIPPPPSLVIGGNVIQGINLQLDKQPYALYAMFTQEGNNPNPARYQTPFYPWPICAIPSVPDMGNGKASTRNIVTYTTSGRHWYGLDNLSNNLTQYNGTTGAIDWTSTVAVYNKGSDNYTRQIAVYPEAHDPRYYIAVVDGALNVIAKETGKVVLGLSQYFFPHSPVNPRRQLMFLLSPENTSDQKFLLPNLMGWNIFESTAAGFPIVETNQHSPVSAPLTYLDQRTLQPYLIWIDFTTAAVQCVRMKM